MESAASSIDVIDGKAVRECLPMNRCIECMIDTIKALHQGAVLLTERVVLPLFDSEDKIMIMPAAKQSPSIIGVKTTTLMPSNAMNNRPTIQGHIALFDLDTGAPIALVDAASITLLRTAASSAVATRYLSNTDAELLTLIGTGPQVEAHVHAMLAVRPIRQVKVWGRNAEKANVLAQRLSQQINISIAFEKNLKAAVESADIVCTLTSSQEPLIKGEWIKPGTHINLVGAHTANTREVDTETIRRSRVFVELRSSALREGGDILIPLSEGEFDESHIQGELGQVIIGDLDGRVNREDITAYKSLGNASQDLMAAWEALVLARSAKKEKNLTLQN